MTVDERKQNRTPSDSSLPRFYLVLACPLSIELKTEQNRHYTKAAYNMAACFDQRLNSTGT